MNVIYSFHLKKSFFLLYVHKLWTRRVSERDERSKYILKINFISSLSIIFSHITRDFNWRMEQLCCQWKWTNRLENVDFLYKSFFFKGLKVIFNFSKLFFYAILLLTMLIHLISRTCWHRNFVVEVYFSFFARTRFSLQFLSAHKKFFTNFTICTTIFI